MHEHRLWEPPIMGACSIGSPMGPTKWRKLGKQHAPANAKHQDGQMKQADARGQASNRGAAVALRMKLDGHRGAQERPPVSTEMDASPVPDQAGPSAMDMPGDEHNAQMSCSFDDTHQSKTADVQLLASELLNGEPQMMQQPGSAGAMNREADCNDATYQCLEQQSEVLRCVSVDPTLSETPVKEALEGQHGQHDSSDGVLAPAALPPEPMEVDASDDVTAEQNSMDITTWQQKLASAMAPQPTSALEEPVSAAADVDGSGQPLHLSIPGAAASPARQAAPQAQLFLPSTATAGEAAAAEAVQKEASVTRSAAQVRTGGPVAEQARHSDTAADMKDVNSIIKNAIAKAFGTGVSPQKRKAVEMEEQPLEEKPCPVEKKRLVTDSITAFFKGIRGLHPFRFVSSTTLCTLIMQSLLAMHAV